MLKAILEWSKFVRYTLQFNTINLPQYNYSYYNYNNFSTLTILAHVCYNSVLTASHQEYLDTVTYI
jgi:hypothetical protein